MIKKKKCFVVSSIGEEGSKTRKINDEKFDYIFKPVLKELGYEIVRADKIYEPGLISEKIVTRLISDDIVIVDVSDENPNVFYELAVRNAVFKPVILTKKVKQVLPFDTFDKNAISIDSTSLEKGEKSKEILKNYILEAEKDPNAASKSILSNCIKCEIIKLDNDIKNMDSDEKTVLDIMLKFGKVFPKYDFIIMLLNYKGNLSKLQLISLLNNYGNNWESYINKKMYKKNDLFYINTKNKKEKYHLTKKGEKYAQEIIGRAITCQKKIDE